MKTHAEIVDQPNVKCLQSGIDGGLYVVKTATGMHLRVIASWGAGWDHASVCRHVKRLLEGRQTPPSWAHMSLIKSIFFYSDETAMQLHVPSDEHINDHGGTLHLWRPHNETIPRPPGFMV